MLASPRRERTSLGRASTDGNGHSRCRKLTKIKSKDHQISLGQVSQRTCISEQLAEKLHLPIRGSESLTVNTFSSSKHRQLETRVT